MNITDGVILATQVLSRLPIERIFVRHDKRKVLDEIEKRVETEVYLKTKPISSEVTTTATGKALSLGSQSIARQPIDHVTDQQVIQYQENELKKQLQLAELHLKEGNRILGKPCDCGEKHGIIIEALAEETISICPQRASLYNKIAEFARDLQVRGTPQAVASGVYDKEYPDLAAMARKWRKELSVE